MIIVLTSIRTVCRAPPRQPNGRPGKSRPRGPGLKGKRWRNSGRPVRSEISFRFVARPCQRACAPRLLDRPELVDGLLSGVAEAGSRRRLAIRAPKQDRERGMASAATGILPPLAVHWNAGRAAAIPVRPCRSRCCGFADRAPARREISRALDATGSELRAWAVAPKGWDFGVPRRLQAARLRNGAISLTLRPAWSYS